MFVFLKNCHLQVLSLLLIFFFLFSVPPIQSFSLAVYNSSKTNLHSSHSSNKKKGKN